MKWKGKVAKLKEKLAAIPKGTKQLAATDEKLRHRVEAQAASLAELEQQALSAQKLATALERQLRNSTAASQRELAKQQETIDDLRKQIEEREKELRHAMLRVRPEPKT